MRIVYADVVFAVNFTVDLIILYVCADIFKITVKKTKMIITGLVGAFYALIIAVLDVQYYVAFVIGGVVSVIMMRILFGKRSKKVLFRMTVVFFTVSFLLCGFVNVFAVFLSEICKGEVPVWGLFMCAGTLMLMCMFFSRTVCESVSKKKAVILVETSKSIKEYVLLCDSGNLLCDPYSNLPVIVLNKNAQYDLIDKECTYSLCVENGFRYIPVNTAFGSGVIKGIKPKSIKVKNCKSEFVNVDAIVAFSPNDNNTFGGNDGIIPQNIIELIN